MLGSDQIITTHNLFAEKIGYFWSFPITTSLLNSWLALAIVIVLSLVLKAKIQSIPGLFQNFLESTIDLFLNLFDTITGDRKRSLLFAPLVLSFFFFILINNWLGILPGVGSIGLVVLEHGQKVFVPFFRGATADLNTTLALASFGVVASHVMAVSLIGGWSHFNKFFKLQALLDIPKQVIKEPSVLLINPIKVFVGLIEIIGELAKLASLSFRLFGNIFAGEVLLASMSALLAFAIPIPFMFLEILVGLVQALIFSLLVLIYLSLGSVAEEH